MLKPFDVDFVIIITLYLLAFHNTTGAGVFAFGQGLISDIFSGGIAGLFTLLYLLIFFAIRLAARPLDPFSVGGQIVIVSFSVLIKKGLMMLFMLIFPVELVFSLNTLSSSVFSSISSGLLAPVMFYIFNRLFQPCLSGEMGSENI